MPVELASRGGGLAASRTLPEDGEAASEGGAKQGDR